MCRYVGIHSERGRPFGHDKANGEGCSLEAVARQKYCWSHDPAHAEERRRNSRRSGKLSRRGKPLTEERLRSRIHGLEQSLGLASLDELDNPFEKRSNVTLDSLHDLTS